eukprot:CAMPEP_0177626256 /NCGR_PEP_ID=MMETSP0419_2-20121207/30552_1 /TAXON_ID=582737 /ORGANISM="Tetraselmis sp., Strain GSL018" /LENGTH=262 /DNA_ID=CAMNT_0019127289 /DNA_START=23 /DNA_END=808 /DNA_ORIENTATION=-
MTAKMRWGDSLDDEDDALPPPEVLGPDKNGIKQLITYKKNDKGETIKQTCRVRVVKVEKKIYKSALERKKWKKFGAAANQESEITVQANDDIMFEKTRIKQKSEQEKKVSVDKSAVVGNLKDMLYKKRMERAMLAAKGLGPQPELPPAEDDSHLPSKPSAGGYVAPHLRGAGGAGSSGPDRKREENSVRVTNLSEDTTEQDLRDLFSVFGNIQRIYVAYDRDTRESRGFAFVNFMYREDAQRAINKLDGYGYDNLILRVEWA